MPAQVAFERWAAKHYWSVAAAFEDRHELWVLAPSARLQKRSLPVKRTRVSGRDGRIDGRMQTQSPFFMCLCFFLFWEGLMHHLSAARASTSALNMVGQRKVECVGRGRGWLGARTRAWSDNQ
jgi:hypothetical protein